MQKNMVQLAALLLTALVLVTVAVLLVRSAPVDCLDLEALSGQRFQLDSGFQTSSAYLYKVAKWKACSAPDNADAQLRYQLASDINIKTRSYALINKISFWISIVFVLTIFAIPIAHAVRETTETGPAPKKVTLAAIAWKLLSPMQLPALTMIAGLSFTLYESYKEKQNQAESLMRYVLFTEQPAEQLTSKIIDTLAVIDTGFSFTSFMSGSADEPK